MKLSELLREHAMGPKSKEMMHEFAWHAADLERQLYALRRACPVMLSDDEVMIIINALQKHYSHCVDAQNVAPLIAYLRRATGRYDEM